MSEYYKRSLIGLAMLLSSKGLLMLHHEEWALLPGVAALALMGLTLWDALNKNY